MCRNMWRSSVKEKTEVGGSWVQSEDQSDDCAAAADGQRECKHQQQSQHLCVFSTSSAPVRAAGAVIPSHP